MENPFAVIVQFIFCLLNDLTLLRFYNTPMNEFELKQSMVEIKLSIFFFFSQVVQKWTERMIFKSN